MAHQVHGQHVGRQERTESTRQWLGAGTVEPDGSVKQAQAEPDPAVVEREVKNIQHLVRTGVKVRLDISDEVVIAAIKQALTPDELAKVQFGAEEFPVA